MKQGSVQTHGRQLGSVARTIQTGVAMPPPGRLSPPTMPPRLQPFPSLGATQGVTARGPVDAGALHAQKPLMPAQALAPLSIDVPLLAPDAPQISPNLMPRRHIGFDAQGSAVQSPALKLQGQVAYKGPSLSSPKRPDSRRRILAPRSAPR